MERRDDVKVKSGKEYDYLFPRAMLTTITKKEGATVADTIKFIPQVVNETLFHTKKIAKLLEGDTIRETCRNIWQFVYDHIAYKKDEDGKEQIRSPARVWHDRGNIQGVDCDCYTVFISSILSNLKIKHVLRITKYKEDHFQHIYPIVPLDKGGYITIDCVVRRFDYEEPYTEKKDTKMDLEYLNGLGETSNYKNTDALEMLGIDEDKEAMAQIMGLGRTKKKIKFKDVLKKGFHLTNILNPATATIRAGVLLSAKLNIMKIGERLKWAYMSDADAKKKGLDMGRLAKLKKIMAKMEQIFYAMGGKPENLKKAVLKGKGNKNHDVVSGLGYVPDEMDGIDENASVSTILGTEIYNDELSGIDDGANGLGIVAATAIASATGVIGAIAALIKGVGNMFPKKGKDAEGGGGGGDGTSTTDSGGGDSGSGTPTVDTSSTTPDKSTDATNTDGTTTDANNKVARKKSDTPATTNDDTSKDDTTGADDTTTKPDSKAKTFWLNNKKWIKPTGFGLAGLLAFFTGLHFYKKHKKEETPVKKQTVSEPAVSGIPKSRKKKKRKGGHPNIKSKKKEAVALM